MDPRVNSAPRVSGCQELLGMPFSRVMGKGGKGKGGRVTKVRREGKQWETAL